MKEGTEGRKGREMGTEVKGEGIEERKGKGHPVPDWESEKVATLEEGRQEEKDCTDAEDADEQL